MSNKLDQIKPQYKIFSQEKDNRIKTKLIGKNRINNDYVIMRFQLPQQNKCLGLKLGQYVWLQLNDKRRQYVPISPIDEPNYIDLLIRDMTKQNVGSFTQKLLDLPMQSQVVLVGPGTQFIYQGYGKLKYFDQTTQKQKQKTYKNIGIITHSSAITTSFALIQSISMNHDNRTGISLLWLGDKQSDFIFVDELVPYVQQSKLNLNLMLTSLQKGWLGPYGKVTQYHVKDFMPPPAQDTFILMSGVNQILPQIPTLIKSMGYKDYLNL